MADRFAVVTGGNKGIGRACVQRLLEQGYGVLATGRDTDALEATAEELGPLGRLETAAFDVTDEDAVAEHLDGRHVDVLVANAGMDHSAPVHKLTLEDWNRVLAVNLTGPMLCVRAVLPGMRERDRGRLITIASVAALRADRYISAYAASKHGVLGFMRGVAAEVAGTGVTANCVCPAYVDTPMTERTMAKIQGFTGSSEEEAREFLAGEQGAGRLIRPDEVAGAVAYLVSEDAATVNGQTIVLEGGRVQT